MPWYSTWMDVGSHFLALGNQALDNTAILILLSAPARMS